MELPALHAIAKRQLRVGEHYVGGHQKSELGMRNAEWEANQRWDFAVRLLATIIAMSSLHSFKSVSPILPLAKACFDDVDVLNFLFDSSIIDG